MNFFKKFAIAAGALLWAMVPSFATDLSAAGPSAGVSIGVVPGKTPTIFVKTTAGAVLTYNIEVTAAAFDPSLSGFPSNTNWYPLDATAIGLTAGGSPWQVASIIRGARINITSYTSGTLTWDVAQQ